MLSCGFFSWASRVEFFFEIRRYFSKIASNSADTAVNAIKTVDAPLS